MCELGLSVRTQNVLSNQGWVTVDVVRALDDRTILRAKDAGRRVLDELRARGLRPDSCTVAGCERHLGHAGEHVQYASPYARRVERPPAPQSPRRVIVEVAGELTDLYVLRTDLELSVALQRPVSLRADREGRTPVVLHLTTAEAALLADELVRRLRERP